MGGGVGGFIVGGPVGAVAGGISGGTAIDALTTGLKFSELTILLVQIFQISTHVLLNKRNWKCDT